MKFITINKNKMGLVFKNGTFIKALSEGKHWLGFGKTVQVFDRVGAFKPKQELNVLLEDEVLENALSIIDVKDSEWCMVFKNGRVFKIISTGQYAFWKSAVHYDFKIINMLDYEIDEKFDRNLFQYREVKNLTHQIAIQSYETGLLMVDGQFVRPLKAGTHYFWKNEKTISVLKTDLRKQSMEISGQELLTKDKAAIRVNFDLLYQIVDVEKALLETKDAAKQIYLLMQMAIRTYIGTMTLDELLAKKEDLKEFVFNLATEKANNMGVKLITCGIRDIILPGDVKSIMNQVLIAEKTAKANTIMRREETASTRSLLNTAKLMENNEMLFRLKEMEYIEKIADKIGEISVAGGGQLIEQLQTIFSVRK